MTLIEAGSSSQKDTYTYINKAVGSLYGPQPPRTRPSRSYNCLTRDGLFKQTGSDPRVLTHRV